MKRYQKFEEGIGQGTQKSYLFLPAKKKLGFTLGLGGAVLGVVMIASGLGLLTTVTADVAPAALPPTPPGPSDQVASSASTEPKVLPDGSVEFNVYSGWNMVRGSTLEGLSLTPLLEKNLILYSYNDSAYPVSSWATTPAGGALSGQSASASWRSASLVSPRLPLGYYLYNGAGETKINLVPQSARAGGEKIYAHGWHLLFWPGEVISKDELLSTLTLTYDEEGTMSAVEAVSEKNHRLSPKIFVVVNERSTGSGTVKELGASDDDTTISKIPAKSYFWIYLHRTKNRVVDLQITAGG